MSVTKVSYGPAPGPPRLVVEGRQAVRTALENKTLVGLHCKNLQSESLVFIAGVPKHFRADEIWPDRITFAYIYFYIEEAPSDRYDESKFAQEFSLLVGRPVYAGPGLRQKLDATLPSYMKAMLTETGRAGVRHAQIGVECDHGDDICRFLYGTLTGKYQVENRPEYWALTLYFNKDATETTVVEGFQTFTTGWLKVSEATKAQSTAAFIKIHSFNTGAKFVYTGLALDSKIKELSAIAKV
jgi:hypothetical protein